MTTAATDNKHFYCQYPCIKENGELSPPQLRAEQIVRTTISRHLQDYFDGRRYWFKANIERDWEYKIEFGLPKDQLVIKGKLVMGTVEEERYTPTIISTPAYNALPLRELTIPACREIGRRIREWWNKNWPF